FAAEKFDFHVARRGDPIRATFSYTNASDHNVRLRPAAGNPCNCILAKISKPELKPGEGGWLEVTIDSRPFAGPFVQSVEVSLEPAGAKVQLMIEGAILPPETKTK